jgi:25S rRNA (cytosine2278-C5)-methyltransferase
VQVHAILLDPSCSGSGISTERLDYLLPSHSRGTKGFCSNSPAILFHYLLKKREGMLFDSVGIVVLLLASVTL